MSAYVLIVRRGRDGESSGCFSGGSKGEVVSSGKGEMRGGVLKVRRLPNDCFMWWSSVCEETVGVRRGFLFCLGSNGVLLLVSSECSLAIRTYSGSLTDSSYIAAVGCGLRS